MNSMQISLPYTNIIEQDDTRAIDRKLISNILNELNSLYPLLKDGIIGDDAFIGGLPMPYLNTDGSLEALTLEESRQIRQAITEASQKPDKTFGLSLLSLINWIPFFKDSDDGIPPASKDQQPSPAIIGLDGRILPISKDDNLDSLIEKRLNAQGLPRLSAYWNAISEVLERTKHEETDGDLKLIDINRKQLNAKRLNATPFEQAAQSFSARISSRFCNSNGDIISPESLEELINQLVENLLEKTKDYWTAAPLLSLFDAIVVPVLRPMLFPHQTWTSEHDYFSKDGVYDVGQLANKRTSLETTPAWNDAATQQAFHFVEEALKHHLSLRYVGLQLFDAFSPYNWEIHSAEHFDPSGFKGKTKSFGPPVHPKDVVQLIQQPSKRPEEKVLDKVMTYRSSEEGIWH